jgi:hypothetical protein
MDRRYVRLGDVPLETGQPGGTDQSNRGEQAADRRKDGVLAYAWTSHGHGGRLRREFGQSTAMSL